MSEEAAYWFLLCSDEPASVLFTERREFCAWLGRSPENVAELLQISRMSKRMGRVRLMVRTVELLDRNIIPFPQRTTQAAPNHTHRSDSRRRPARLAGMIQWAAVALIAAILIGGSSESHILRSIETGPKEVRSFVLSDGSIVHLSAHTKIATSFTDHQRMIYLLEGAGVFEVSKAPRRPFTVRTYLVDTTAVGTRFGMSIDDGVTTTVTEGIVTVARRGNAHAANAVQLKAGQELHASDEVSANVDVRSVDVARKLAWASGWVILHGDTLAEGAEAFNRFNRLRIVIASPELAQRRLPYYRFRLHEPEEFATAVAASPDVALIIDRQNQLLKLVSEKP